MLVPGRGYDNSRLADTEMRGERTLRVKAEKRREPTWKLLRQGEHRAVCTQSIAHGSTGRARLFYFNGERYVWTSKYVTCRCFWLNSDESIAVDFVGMVKFFADNVWEWTLTQCEEADWLEDLDIDSSPGGGSPGEVAARAAQPAGEGAALVAGEVAAAPPEIFNQGNVGAIGGPNLWQV